MDTGRALSGYLSRIYHNSQISEEKLVFNFVLLFTLNLKYRILRDANINILLYLIECWEIFILQNFFKNSRKVSLLKRIEAVGKFGMNLLRNAKSLFYLKHYDKDGIYLSLKKSTLKTREVARAG